MIKKWKPPKYTNRTVFNGKGDIITHFTGNPIFDRIRLEWMNFIKPQYHTSIAEPPASGNWVRRYGIFDFIRKKI